LNLSNLSNLSNPSNLSNLSNLFYAVAFGISVSGLIGSR
jgi:hypothetical protein